MVCAQSQKNKWLEKLDKAKELQIDLQRDNDLLERDKAELAQNLHKEQVCLQTLMCQVISCMLFSSRVGRCFAFSLCLYPFLYNSEG